MNNKLSKFLKCFTVCGISGLLAFTTLAIANNTVNQNQYKTAKADTITDLTNTQWVINSSTCSARQGEYSLSGSIFVNNNEYALDVVDTNNINLGYYFYDEMWEGEANQVLVTTTDITNWLIEINSTNLSSNTYLIHITGGRSSQSSDLITWFQANATLQSGGGSEPEEPTPEEPELTITDLSNTQWTMNFLSWNNPSLNNIYRLNIATNQGNYNTLTINNGSTDSSKYVHIYNTLTEREFYLVQNGVVQVENFYMFIDGLGVDNQNTDLIQWFLNNGSITPFTPVNITETFTFEENFNFNAPVNLASNVQYFLKGDYVTNSNEYIYTLTLPRFIVGGVEYDTIKIQYANADQRIFEQLRQSADGSTYVSYPQIVGTNYIYYLYMWFLDSTKTEPTLDINNAVNSRTASRITVDNGTEITYFTPNTHWRSPDFRTLLFIEELSPEDRLKLNAFNENIYGFNQEVTNGYLVNVFNLFNLAFMSWIPILNVQIIPGITVGMLLFMPLVVGIILTIIWLVKR